MAGKIAKDADKGGGGTPDWIRTNGLQLRRLTLYPAELRALTFLV